MTPALILCVPGPWSDRNDFLRQVVALEPEGSFMFAGGILAHVAAQDHVSLEFEPADPHLPGAFEIAGQGLLSEHTLQRIETHRSVVYLHFPIDIRGQRERLAKFSDVMRRLGGFAVKLESCGIAHTFGRWLERLAGTDFDLYSSCVVLIGGEDEFYSCGMHHFELAECAVMADEDPGAAADLMNRFNYWRIVEQPVLESGHTFSLDEESPHYRVELTEDTAHESDDLFFNPHGVWHLSRVDS